MEFVDIAGLVKGASQGAGLGNKFLGLFAALREKHIYVRYFPKDRIDNHLRITIGTDEEMKKLVEFLTEYLQK